MKHKYESMDIRTGYKVGEVIELDYKELIATPFNVYLKSLDVIDNKEKIKEDVATKESRLLRELLFNKGLSKGRIDKVLAKYSTLPDLQKNAKKAGIDKLTDEWLATEFVVEGDLDGDGDFDKDDKSIASKVLAKRKK